MNYWNYPTMGTGTHSYVHPTYGTLSANFGATTYGWASMPDPGSASSYNTALATLLYHCGISVDMNYGPTGSGASTAQVANSLVSYFGYASSANYIVRSSYSDDAWKGILIAELDAGRPMEYRGSGTGGHAFVCDGWQATDHFHFNWGWGGSADGYYYLDNLNPDGANFTNYQGAVIGIQPSSTNPIIAFDPLALSFIAVQNENLPSSQQLDVYNGGGGTLNWTVSESASWLSLSPSSGTNTGTVTVSITSINLSPGSYLTNITVSGNADNSPQTLPVYYAVYEPFVVQNPILIVKDEVGYIGDIEYIVYYTDALDANGYLYDIWDTFIYGTPSASLLENYHDGLVIWYSGWKNPQLDLNERTSIGTFLDNGGKLFYNDQDLGWYINEGYPTVAGISWYNNYFYSTYIQDGVGLYGVNGISGDAITHGIDISLTNIYGQWWPSEIDPISPATSIFHYDPSATVSSIQSNSTISTVSTKPIDSNGLDTGIASTGTAGIKVDNGTYKLVYLAFGFESITDEPSRATLMDKILNWLNPTPCSTNGAIIYNTETGKFNFCEDGVWVEK